MIQMVKSQKNSPPVCGDQTAKYVKADRGLVMRIREKIKIATAIMNMDDGAHAEYDRSTF
jgi:hypothetical protein